MISLRDIFDALMFWKKKADELKARLEKIEERLNALEKRPKREEKSCRFCGEKMELKGLIPDPDFFKTGVQIEAWECTKCKKREAIKTQSVP